MAFDIGSRVLYQFQTSYLDYLQKIVYILNEATLYVRFYHQTI